MYYKTKKSGFVDTPLRAEKKNQFLQGGNDVFPIRHERQVLMAGRILEALKFNHVIFFFLCTVLNKICINYKTNYMRIKNMITLYIISMSISKRKRRFCVNLNEIPIRMYVHFSNLH